MSNICVDYLLKKCSIPECPKKHLCITFFATGLCTRPNCSDEHIQFWNLGQCPHRAKVQVHIAHAPKYLECPFVKIDYPRCGAYPELRGVSYSNCEGGFCPYKHPRETSGNYTSRVLSFVCGKPIDDAELFMPKIPQTEKDEGYHFDKTIICYHGVACTNRFCHYGHIGKDFEYITPLVEDWYCPSHILGFCFKGPNCGKVHSLSTFTEIPLCDGSCGTQPRKTPNGQVYYWGSCKERHRGETLSVWVARTCRSAHLARIKKN